MSRMVDQPGDHNPLWTVRCSERAPGVRELTWRSGHCLFVELPTTNLRWLHNADVVWTACPADVARLFTLLPGCKLVVVRGNGTDAYSQDGRRWRLRGNLDRAALLAYQQVTSA